MAKAQTRPWDIVEHLETDEDMAAYLEERKARLQGVREDRTEELMRFLREEIWPKIPPELLGRGISQAEQDEILGYGVEGGKDDTRPRSILATA